MRRWRYEHQGNLWTRGSKIRVCGRAIFCLIFTFIFFFVSIILSLLLVCVMSSHLCSLTYREYSGCSHRTLRSATLLLIPTMAAL